MDPASLWLALPSKCSQLKNGTERESGEKKAELTGQSNSETMLHVDGSTDAYTNIHQDGHRLQVTAHVQDHHHRSPKKPKRIAQNSVSVHLFPKVKLEKRAMQARHT